MAEIWVSGDKIMKRLFFPNFGQTLQSRGTIFRIINKETSFKSY